MKLSASGEPVYGPRDEADVDAIRALGLPYWLAGGRAHPEAYKEARARGAAGIQVGTAFAFCEESGMSPEIRREVISRALSAGNAIFTDPRASPTGFPFKVLALPGSVSERDVYEARPRLCNLGYLRKPYRRPDGTLGYRCPGEPEEAFLAKGGQGDEMAGRKCLCNGLLADIGHAQRQASGYLEPALVTAGHDIDAIRQFVTAERPFYSANAVIHYILPNA